MQEDRLLLWKLKRGDANALQRLYEKYKHDLLGLALALAQDRAAGEDAVHDVFVSFVRLAPKLRLRTSLRSYLLSAVANRVRSLNQVNARRAAPPAPPDAAAEGPASDHAVFQRERARLIGQAVAQLPDGQREVIILHLQSGMTFREIAVSQETSINTIQSRYRYGLEKLRSLLDGKVTP
jgi:RNA polymerase sigma-70 factor (ECF subfamily)